jgi:hypothetical protein
MDKSIHLHAKTSSSPRPVDDKPSRVAHTFNLAERFCANYQRGGFCTGTGTLLDGRQVRIFPEGSPCRQCAGERCAYFEQAVLPLENWTWVNPGAGAAFLEAATRYRRLHALMGELPRKCTDCRARIGKRKRYCARCAAKRKAQSNRNRSELHS